MHLASMPGDTPPPETLDTLRQRLQDDGFVVVPGAVGADAVKSALRQINLAIRLHGLTADQIGAGQQTTFFPHLRSEREIWDVLPPPAAELLGWREGDDWAEPQLLLRFPDEDQPWPSEPHIDEPPAWAAGRKYRGIVGVALSPAQDHEGAPLVWPGSHVGSHAEPKSIDLAAGDALYMHPQLAHCGTLNLGSNIRYAIYFRLLAGA